ncbi:MAG: DUF2683 family protein [Candidatus Thermoplasmatota archaeon]|jgi:hypothetical protein|nr:DUF2683 family protein [Candidatus Thermoplasmatota archaeon]
MVQAFIDINERANRIINILKAKYGLKDKSQAIELAMDIIEKEHLEPELRPEYLEKLQKIRKGKYTKFTSLEELRRLTK